MKAINLRDPAPCQEQPERQARLVRHLAARLQDFGPGGPELICADQDSGRVCARFPGHSCGQIVSRLEKEFGVLSGVEGDCVLFRLSPGVQFEELDYLWGCLYQLL